MNGDSPQRIPAAVVTGFLGSGKTTLIQHWLSHGLGEQRVAVIVNDLAEYNIDGQVLKGMNVDRLVKLAGGCVCCSGIYQLGLALREISHAADPTLILIETSGASAPGAVIEELTHLGYPTDAVITVVDAIQVLDLAKIEDVIQSQIEEADFIVLNKADLTTPRQLRKIRTWLNRLNTRAEILETSFGKVPADLVLSTGISGLRRSAPSRHRHPDGMEHFTWSTPDLMDLARFGQFLTRLPKSIYRAKGILRFHGEPHPRLLNYTCGRYNLDPFRLPPLLNRDGRPGTQLVFVGRGLSVQQESIGESLARCTSSHVPQAPLLARLFGR
jgi:G3E family GTPase